MIRIDGEALLQEVLASSPCGARGPLGGDLEKPAGSAYRRTPLASGEALHNANGWKDTAKVGLEKEQPWHLMAAYMVVAGRTNSEIAMAAGVSVASVAGLRAQRWFQERLSSIANTDGQELLGSIKGHALAAIERIAHIAENGESERNRLSANTYLADQAVGKAVQKTLNINASAVSGLTPKEEMEATLAQLAELRRVRETSAPQAMDPTQAMKENLPQAMEPMQLPSTNL